jgi:hypothetical protein
MTTTNYQGTYRERGWKPSPGEVVSFNGKIGTYKGEDQIRSNSWWNMYVHIIEIDGKEYYCDYILVFPTKKIE